MQFTRVFYKIAEGFKDNRFVIQQGGSSSSKTYSNLQFLVIWSLRSNKTKLVSVVAESIPHLKRGAYRDFLKILMSSGLYKEENHNKTDFTYKLKNWTFEFFSADNDAKLRGARRDILYVNECNNISWDSFTQLEIRTREKIFLDFNPVSRFWVHSKIMVHGQKYSFIKSTYKDNVDHITGEPLLEESIIKAIESRRPVYDESGNLISGDEHFWKVYGLGEVGSLEGTVLTNWEQSDSFPADFKWSCYGVDFGFTNDPTTIIHVGMSNGELWLRELCYETGLTNQDISKKLKELGIGPNDEIIADSSEPKSIAEIKREGFRFIRGATKGKDSINNGIDILKRYKINVHSKSTNAINELSNYQWLRDKDGNWLNKPMSGYDHIIDPLRYIVIDKIGLNRQERKGLIRKQ